MKLEQIMFHFYLIIVYYFKQYSHYWSLDIWAINMKLPGTLMDLEYILILCVIFLNYKWEFNLVQVSLITYWKQKKKIVSVGKLEIYFYWYLLTLLNCGAGEDFWESLGLHGDPTSPS